jgi:hypothetical protein
VLVLGLMALGPYADLTVAQERVATLEARQADLGSAVVALEEEAARLQDPRALEAQAREDLGMVRPGELPYIVADPLPTAPPTERAAAPSEAPAGPPSAWDRVLAWARSWGR